ncbi:hypothetical protein DH2020_010675 [Rehmannia glutinosa]|uniref:VDE lipocalin domain-containing protein n=1 Tax=Rehmannia glutinosa TaxID=99300 RepID=A0ABR0XBC5_REHGL
MAFPLYSGVLSNGEIILLHNKSQLDGRERYNWSGVYLNGNLTVGRGSSGWNFRYLKLLKNRQSCKGLGRRFTNVFSVGSNKTPLSHGISAIIAEAKKKVDIREVMSLVFWKQWGYVNGAAILLTLALMIIPSADAVDALKTCTCLLKECRLELAKCIANPSCAANIACLQTCNNRPDETECQIKCGDLFENSVVDQFNECAVSRKKCVPRKSDVGEFPAPDPALLVQNFNINDFNGKWFITSGLNPTFDTFDCQLHEFHAESDKLVANLSWRIKTPDTGFFTRSTVQRFVQDPKYPGILYNHDNEFLHYQDDWYILSSKIENQPDDYIFVYYRGRNDAWDGYGGAVVYTRSAVLPESIIPQLEKAAQSVGRDFRNFIRTDNTCGPEPPLVERLEKTVEEGEEIIVKEVEEIEQEVEKVKNTELSLFQRLSEGFQELIKDKDYFLKELSKEEMDVLSELQMEANEEYSRKSGQIPAFGDWENANELPITQYFECARQAGLFRCSCSGECGGSYFNHAAGDLYGVGFEKPLPRRVYAVPQRKTKGISNKGCSHSKDQRKQVKVTEFMNQPRNQPLTPKKHYPKQSRKSGNVVSNKSSTTVKPVDEDLYKIPPQLLQNSKRKKMLGFFSRCMVPPCAA